MSTPWQQAAITPKLWESMFYSGYSTARTAIVTPLLIGIVYVILRVAGSRTLTQATLFNKIVLVAIGSLVGSGAIMPNGPLAPLIVATLMIVGMALLIDAAYAYGFLFGGLVHARPILLYANGEMLTENLRHCLLAPDKLRSELRSQGHTSLSNIFAVVLEPTGIFSVITDGASVGQRSDCFCCCHTLLQMRPRRTSACCRMWRDMSST